MKAIKDNLKRFKKIDKFGEKYTFKYKDKDKYSTIFGGILSLIIFLTGITISLLNLIPFIKKENIFLQFYTVKLNETENIKLNELTNFGVGLDCEVDKKTNITGKDLFDLEFNFDVRYKVNPNDSYKETVLMENFNKSSFYKENIEVFSYLQTEGFQALLSNNSQDNALEGIFTEKKFSFLSITVLSKNKSKEHFDKINDYLLNNECNLQFYYSDITVNISNYEEPTKPFIDSIFLQINPHLYIKKNLFFMKYHFKYDNRLFPILNSKSEEEEKIGFSRAESYFTYQGLDRLNSISDNADDDKYAKLYIRVDNKKVEIQRKYQSFLEFYAENTSFWFDAFWLIDLFISIVYNYASNRILSKKLFIFEGTEDSKAKYSQYKDSRNKPPITDTCIIKENNISKIFPKNIEIENISGKSQDISKISAVSTTAINPIKNKDKKKKQNPITIMEVCKVSICHCFIKNLSFKEQLIKQSIDFIEKKLDIFIYIRNMILIDILYKILIDENNKDHINFLSRILVYKNPNGKEEELNDFYKPLGKLDLEKLYDSFYELENKKEEIRTETEKKILKLFKNQLK